ncbi:hypothetical protein DFH28DRAFT_967279 [Melampsora americana]|nr:hypothetical protein DFH28DRAFT_967279 [Melampsora americana]
MSQIIKSRVFNFVISLTPDVNPYQATADYVESFLLPCTLPSWSHYVELVLLAEFIIMFFQSSYILYVRGKTKRIYHIGLNDMGLIQLDRANHCGCVTFYIVLVLAVIEIISEPFDFMLGIQFTLTNACGVVVLWLAICHCLLVRGYLSQRSTPVGQLLPTTVSRALNIFVVVIFLGPTVTIIFAYSRLALEYHQIRQFVMPVLQILRQKASTCSLGTCRATDILPQVITLTPALHRIDLLVYYTRLGIICYIYCGACIFVIYIPVLYRLYQSLKAQRSLFRSSQRQQDKVFANTLVEFAIILTTFCSYIYLLTLIQDGLFIFNPSFFLNVRIGLNGIISNLGNVALCFIICSQWSNDLDPPKVHIPTLPLSPATGYMRSDENSSPCYPYL